MPKRESGNEFTVIIGANGTGKSALLSSIASDLETDLQADAPSRVLAISNLVTDSFPLRATRSSRLPYYYLGLRQGSNSVTTRAATAAAELAILHLPTSHHPDLDWRQVCIELGFNPPEFIATRTHDGGRARANIESTLDAFDFHIRHEWSVAFPDIPTRAELEGAPVSLRKSHAVDYGAASSLFARLLADYDQKMDPAGMLRRVSQATGLRLRMEYERPPSVGQELFFSQIVRIASFSAANCLILIDEPEVALHPQWQSNYISVLRQHLDDELGMHILVATHSPFMVGEADTVVTPVDSRFEQIADDLGGFTMDQVIYRIFGTSASGSIEVEKDVNEMLEYISDGIAAEPPNDSTTHAANRLRARANSETELLNDLIEEFDRTAASRSRGS